MKRKHHFLSTQLITSAISTTLVLVLLGTVVLFVLSARNLSDYVRENINVTVLVNDDLNDLQMKLLKNDFKAAPYVKSVKYISKEKALKDASASMGSDPTEFLGYNPFTASFEINVNAEYATPEEMAKIAKQIKSNPDVVDVIYQKDLIKSVNRNLSKISIVLLIIAGLFTYISFALINNTVRLSIFSQRFIINTMKLVGAKWGFIRRPFLINGMTLGFISAIIADGLLYAGYIGLRDYEPEIDLIVDLQVLLTVGISVFAFGLLISFLCTFASLQRYLKMSTKQLYYV